MIDLEELAQLINKKWPGTFKADLYYGTQVWVRYGNGGGYDLLFNSTAEDLVNSVWIIWAWDQLRFLYLDAGVSIWDKENTGVWSVEVYDEVDMVFSVEAPTRAEALARALLEALREEK